MFIAFIFKPEYSFLVIINTITFGFMDGEGEGNVCDKRSRVATSFSGN